MKKQIIAISLVVPALLFLPGCDWFTSKKVEKEQTAGTATGSLQGLVKSDVLLTIEGKPALTVEEFQNYMCEMEKLQPQLKQLIAIMPNAERQLCQNYAIELILKRYIQKYGIDKSAAYQEDMKRGMQMLEQQLAIKYFQEEFPKKAKLEATDAEARKLYDENKNTAPGLIISRGGITAQAVQFDKEEDAKAFLAKIKSNPNQLEASAKEMKLTVKPLKNVTRMSMDVDQAIREKLDTVTKFPTAQIIKSKDGKYWVVSATAKEETKYIPFEQVKEDIKNQLRMQKLFTEGIDQVKKELNVEEPYKTHFDKKEQEREAELKKLSEQQEAAEQKKPEGAKPELPTAPQTSVPNKGSF